MITLQHSYHIEFEKRTLMDGI